MRVLIDANVLFPTVMRELVLGCAKAGLFHPRWSPRICEEWALAAKKLAPAQEIWARGEIAMINAAFPQASVTPHPDMAARLWLPDPNDVHVLAAALAGHCDAILTMNAQDFPRNLLAEEGLKRVDPDNFLMDLREGDQPAVDGVVAAVTAEARRLSGEDWTARALLKKSRLHRMARAYA